MDLSAFLNLLAAFAAWVVRHWQVVAVAFVALLVLSVVVRRGGSG